MRLDARATYQRSGVFGKSTIPEQRLRPLLLWSRRHDVTLTQIDSATNIRPDLAKCELAVEESSLQIHTRRPVRLRSLTSRKMPSRAWRSSANLLCGQTGANFGT